jgi:hypothetical protein
MLYHRFVVHNINSILKVVQNDLHKIVRLMHLHDHQKLQIRIFIYLDDHRELHLPYVFSNLIVEEFITLHLNGTGTELFVLECFDFFLGYWLLEKGSHLIGVLD